MTAAEQARDTALRLVARPAEEWIDEAVSAIRLIRDLRPGGEFTTDAVWAVLDRRGVAPHDEPRALGAAMRRSVSLGLCEATDRTVKSTRVECHARPVRVWKLTS